MMFNRFVSASALVAAAVLATACDKVMPPEPQVSPAPPATTAAPDPSVPDANAALAASSAQTGTAGLPSTMSEQQKSKAMPLPGQANDHSSPAKADKAASQ